MLTLVRPTRFLALLTLLAAACTGPDPKLGDPAPDAGGKVDSKPADLGKPSTDTPAGTPDTVGVADAGVDAPADPAVDVALEVEPDAGAPDVAEVMVLDLGGSETGGTEVGGAGDAPTEAAADSEPAVPATPCTNNNDCSLGICSTGTCRVRSELLLYWTMDDQSGVATAADSSGSQLNGTYVGNADVLPGIAADSPMLTFPNPAARTFLIASRQALRLTAMPAALRPSNNVTISAWFRVKDKLLGVGNGSEVVSAGDVYSLRVMAGELEFSKRVPNGTGGGKHVQVRGAALTQTDGNWHHIVGSTSPEGMKIYLDGVLLKSNTTGTELRFDRGNDLWVARHGNGSSNYDFNGDIDDVRIYGRALTDADVTWLASGKP